MTSDVRKSLEGPYRIATVAELTGVPEATLRAWERRYGIPSPERTATGYRLYGAAEVEQVREMRRLCEEEGLAAAEAARVVRERKEPFFRVTPVPVSQSHPAVDPRTAWDAAVAAILDAIERFDATQLDEQTRRLLFLGSGRDVFEHVIRPVLVDVGARWEAGDLDVAHEHFASQKLGLVARDLLRLATRSDAKTRVVLASFADDEHELGLYGFGLRVCEWGATPVLLGARTPPSAVRNAVAALEPALVALSVTIPPPRPRARELLGDYAAACGHVPWLVGGAAQGELADLVDKHGGIVAPADPAGLERVVRPFLTRHERRPR